MQIIIPMTGYGSRFVAAGYNELKPMIQVAGKPIIEWIVKGMFGREDRFILVCRKEHFDTGKLSEEYLKSLAPNVCIVQINDWEKLGPVNDIMRAAEYIADDESTIVNYCDFFVPWMWSEVKKQLVEKECDGAVVAFTGFQPCLVPKKNVYASCLCDETETLLEIKEKFCYEEDRFKAKHSTGTYYFKTGASMKKYFQEAIDKKVMLNGEYYASLPYNFMVRDGLEIWVPVFSDKFYTWGTPEDLEEFVFWLDMVRRWNR